jgi:hypothetical protein
MALEVVAERRGLSAAASGSAEKAHRGDRVTACLGDRGHATIDERIRVDAAYADEPPRPRF